ncbi:MAG TPA: hypothetical protein VI122_04925 [Thermoleophilaceae bacterium]|jgi:hypothetical protein
MEHEERADRMEREVERMEEESERVGEEIEDARNEWEAKERDPNVPGAQPPPGEDEESIPGVEADEDELRDRPGP